MTTSHAVREENSIVPSSEIRNFKFILYYFCNIFHFQDTLLRKALPSRIARLTQVTQKTESYGAPRSLALESGCLKSIQACECSGVWRTITSETQFLSINRQIYRFHKTGEKINKSRKIKLYMTFIVHFFSQICLKICQVACIIRYHKWKWTTGIYQPVFALSRKLLVQEFYIRMKYWKYILWNVSKYVIRMFYSTYPWQITGENGTRKHLTEMSPNPRVAPLKTTCRNRTFVDV